MIGSRSSTYRLGQVVIKVPRIDEEAEITQENAKATTIEANVYRILGTHDRIANRLYISPTKDMIMLEFYGHGNLKDYVAIHGPTQLHKWAKQMIEAVQFIHSKGVRHSDIRLNQWLLDSGMNARLSDSTHRAMTNVLRLVSMARKLLETKIRAISCPETRLKTTQSALICSHWDRPFMRSNMAAPHLPMQMTKQSLSACAARISIGVGLHTRTYHFRIMGGRIRLSCRDATDGRTNLEFWGCDQAVIGSNP